ncbi:Protein STRICTOSIDINE SYNTHASE-LIKE 13, partial [Datura stramonium]|nr:Protein STRICTOSIDINE SYNTHASE-LIKE 13 [Datura stramonium]
PFVLSPVGDNDFKPMKNDITPYKQVMDSWHRDKNNRLGLGNLEFVNEIYGPESLEFDILGNGPYAVLADGRIVRWMGEDASWETFAFFTPNWSKKVCAKGKDSTTHKQWKVESQCERPLGLRFNKQIGDLYRADAKYGLLVVGPEGGVATSLATHAEGKPILFANDLDIHKNGSIFFTDTSKKYNRVNHFLIMLEGQDTGRLLRYDIATRSTHVVLDGLTFPSGVQLSKDQTFLLFTETTNCRSTKLDRRDNKCYTFSIEGPNIGTIEIVANLPRFPDNVRVNEKGQFWVAIDCCRTRAQEVLINNPWIRSIYFRLPISIRDLARLMGMRMYTVISLFNENGEIIDVLEDKKGVVMKLVSEVREVNGKLWIGTVTHNHIATLPYP